MKNKSMKGKITCIFGISALQKFYDTAKMKSKWQIIDRYSNRDGKIHVKHYRLFKFFGFRLHSRPEIDAYEFRPAYFRILSTGMLQMRIYLAIPIPFIKYDIDLAIRNIEKRIYL